ncbi:fatty acid hydroxylase family protein [Leptospira fletcheri]|uniref:Fatty acid hydroxylase family protein n=1 Tax=Leptospira fletcheri TaxID=2484981 RepID=A0A4V3JCL2_9LEPT|nr:sterol desaturase family protein [Leptospira fletcheri]TGK06539.1 fatty acid hydroxylase family protein [Leptospira fletcheri]
MNEFGKEAILFLQEVPYSWAALLFLMENLLIFSGSVYIGHLLTKYYRDRRVVPNPPQIESKEILFAVSTLLLNTLVTLSGLWLWRIGLIRFRTDWGLYAFLDVVFLFFVMDALMYALHRIAHISWVYPLVHKTHHNYENPRPLTLFVLNPFEALGFGALWLLVLCLYDSSWIGMSVYLVLNVVFGTLGHLGVEPFPKSWLKIPILRFFTTSSFHAQHHIWVSYNFGFYTLVWDCIFRTLSPDYEESFGKVPTRGEGKEIPPKE